MDNSNNYQVKRLQADLKRLESSDKITQQHKEKIFKFLELVNAQGRSPATKRNIIWTLMTIGEILGKPFEDANYDDIVRVVGAIENRYQSKKSKKALKADIRRFYKWLRQTPDYPPEVSWIKLDYKIDSETNIKPEDLLSDEEVDALANASLNPRDVALIYMLRESGCRIGELLSLRIKHIKFDNMGVVLHVPVGKTGRRRVRLTGKHTKEFLNWLDNHPYKSDPDAFVWISFSGNSKNRQLTYCGAEILLKRLAVKAGLGKWLGGDGRKIMGEYVGRPVNPHNFRHTRATELLIKKKIPEAIVNKCMGWKDGSRMPQLYTHFNEDDMDDAILEAEGIDPRSVEKLEPINTKICTNCGEINTILSHFCKKCNSLLDLSLSWKQKDEAVAKVLEELKKDEWFVKRVKQIIMDIGIEKQFEE